MAILKTDAIVLKGWKFGETSKILSLFSKEYGKIKVIAKGGRSLKSKFKGCLEPLSNVSVIYYHKPTRELQLLSKTDLIDPHLRIFGDVERTTLCMAAAELVDKAITGEEPHPDLYELLSATISVLAEGHGFLEGALWHFQSRFITLMGYKPTWDLCMKCGKPLSMDGGYFQAQNGGLLCHDCGGAAGGLAVSGDTLEILYWFEKGTPAEALELRPSDHEIAEIRKMFDFYFKTHIEHMRSLKSLSIFYEFKFKLT